MFLPDINRKCYQIHIKYLRASALSALSSIYTSVGAPTSAACWSYVGKADLPVKPLLYDVAGEATPDMGSRQADAGKWMGQ